jgi:hypothetical protein
VASGGPGGEGKEVPVAKRTLRNWSAIAVAGTAGMVLGLGSVSLLGGSASGGTAGPTSRCRPADSLPLPGAPQIDCPAPPNPFDVAPFFAADASAQARAQAGPTFDSWAWATFAALNWPAKRSTNPTTYPTGFERGVPDLGTSFAAADDDDVLVWETFKEKRELFQPLKTDPAHKVNRNSAWQAVTFDPRQTPQSGANPGGIPACSEAASARADAMLARRGHHRIFFQGRKHPTAGGTQTGDEIVEVASQAREASSVLCAGYDATTNPTYHDCVTTLFPDDSPQEPHAIDGRTPVGPRVWKGNPGEKGARPVFFEVKVNYDFWRYILDRDLQLDVNSTKAVTSSDIAAHPKLPFRTSSATGPGRSPEAVYGYDAAAVADSYGHLADPNALPGIGSVQLKAAWVMLTPEEIAGKKYHTTEAIFFRSPDPKEPQELCYEVATFGLDALHVIQRVHSQPFDRRNPALFAHGGTFVFATWEHTSLEAEPSGYYYANYFAFPGPLGVEGNYPFTTDLTPFPNFVKAEGGAIPVVRMEPYPLATTQSVNQAVHDRLGPGSIWQNYRLIGTQFVAAGSEAESTAFNQPYYLANLVVETNDGLQKFQGLPPGVSTPSPGMALRGDITPYYTQKVNIRGTSVVFERDYQNLIFNRELSNPVNMGGCMGCHGVAQLKGFNFSFVFLGGQAGSGIDTQYHFAVAGGALPTSTGN